MQKYKFSCKFWAAWANTVIFHSLPLSSSSTSGSVWIDHCHCHCHCHCHPLCILKLNLRALPTPLVTYDLYPHLVSGRVRPNQNPLFSNKNQNENESFIIIIITKVLASKLAEVKRGEKFREILHRLPASHYRSGPESWQDHGDDDHHRLGTQYIPNYFALQHFHFPWIFLAASIFFYEPFLREGSGYQIRWILGKVLKGRGHFQSKSL